MSCFKCKRCLTEYKYKHHLTSHLSRKNPCPIVEGGENIEPIVLYEEATYIPPKLFECEICKKRLATRQSLHTHKKMCIAKNSTNTNAIISGLKDTIKKLEKNVEKLQRSQQQTQPTPQTVNISNNITTINNVTNITINAWGNERMDHITHDFLTECAYKRQNGFKKLIEQIHFNPDLPENHNIGMWKVSRKLAVRWVNNAWEPCDQNEAVEDLINRNGIILLGHVFKNMEEDKHYDKCMEYLNSINKTGVQKENYYNLRNAIIALLNTNLVDMGKTKTMQMIETITDTSENNTVDGDS